MFVTRASTSAGKRSGGTRERAHTCGEGRKVNLAVLRRTTDGDHLARNHRAPAARVPPRQHQEPDAGVRGGGDARACHRERSEEHTSELQSPCNLVCRLLLEKKKKMRYHILSCIQ